MSPKEQFDACMKLADFGAGRWDARRQYEWRLSLGVWALLAAAIGTLRVEALPVWIGILAFLLYIWWGYNLWIRNKWERDFMWNFAHESQRLLEVHKIKVVPPKESLAAQRFIADWSAQFQCGTTLLLIIVGYLACAKRISYFEFIR